MNKAELIKALKTKLEKGVDLTEDETKLLLPI